MKAAAMNVWGGTARFRLVLAVVVALCVVFAATQPAFTSITNIKDLLTNSAVLWIVAVGMTFVILGEVSISRSALRRRSAAFSWRSSAASALQAGLP